MEKKTWNQLLELIDFALADGTAPEIETEQVWKSQEIRCKKQRKWNC